MYFQDIGTMRFIVLESEKEISAYKEDDKSVPRTVARRLWVSIIYDGVHGCPLDFLAKEEWIDFDTYQEWEQYIDSERGSKYLDQYVGRLFAKDLYCLYLYGEKLSGENDE